MAFVREVQKMLRDAEIILEVVEISLSYVKCLLPAMNKHMLLLHRTASEPLDGYKGQPRGKSVAEVTVDDVQLSELDRTGSPLEVNLDIDYFDESVIDQQNWMNEEECHYPLTISEARVALNYLVEYLDQRMWTMPVISICDGKDHDRTVLLGTYTENDWFTIMQARVLESVPFETVVNTPSRFIKEYAETFLVQEREITISVHSTYQLFGKSQGLTDWTQSATELCNSTVNLEVNWNSPTFYAPIKASTAKLIMEIAGGWNYSYLQNMWEELTSLHDFMTILTERKTNHLESFASLRSAKSYKKLSQEEIDGRLISLINCENQRVDSYRNEDDVYEDTEEVTLQKHLENAKLRSNKDFTDYLWELLIWCPDYVQVKEIICSLLQKMRTSCIDPQILTTRSTRMRKILSEIVSDNLELPLLNELLPLEILVDIGFEKLTRDYSYILSSSNFLDCYEFQQHFCHIQAESSDMKNYCKKLTSLGQIHMCLEFMLLAQTHINCSTANLKPVFTTAFRQFASERSAIKSFSELLGNSVQCLEVVLPSVTVQKIIQGLPSMWYLTISSESKDLKVTTTSHLSRNPIIPPNIYDFDGLSKPDTYHLIQVTSNSMNINTSH